MKYASNRQKGHTPSPGARQAFEPIQDGRIYIEHINGPFLFADKGTPAEYSAGLELALSRGWLKMHDLGPSPAGAELFA